MFRRNVAVIVFSHYPADPRVRREAEALAEAGYAIDLICLRDGNQTKRERFANVLVHRLPVQRKRGGKLRYIWQYVAFGALAGLQVTWLHLRRRFRLIHVHNMPDLLVFSALAPRLTGAKVILDLHDPMPEMFMTKYDLPRSHRIIRFVSWLEKLSIRFANVVLTPNISFRDRFVSRSCRRKKIHIIMNSPQESIFGPGNDSHDSANAGSNGKTPGPFTIMYHGTIVARHGLETALMAMQQLRPKIDGLRFEIYGSGDFVDECKDLASSFGLQDMVTFHGHVPLEQIAHVIPTAHLGLIPNNRSPFTEINLPTRIFEYLALRRPVVAPRTHGILDYFDEDSLYFFDAGDANSLAEVILRVYNNRFQPDQVLANGVRIYNKYRWQSQRRHFLRLVNAMLNTSPRNDASQSSAKTEVTQTQEPSSDGPDSGLRGTE